MLLKQITLFTKGLRPRLLDNHAFTESKRRIISLNDILVAPHQYMHGASYIRVWDLLLDFTLVDNPELDGLRRILLGLKL